MLYSLPGPLSPGHISLVFQKRSFRLERGSQKQLVKSVRCCPRVSLWSLVLGGGGSGGKAGVVSSLKCYVSMEWTPAASGQNGWWDHKWSPFHSGVNGPCRLMVCQAFRSQAGSHVGPGWWVPEHLRTVFHESFHGFFYLEDTPELFHCNGCSFSWAWVMGLPHRSSECHPPTDLLGLLLKLPQRWYRNFWALQTGLSSSTVVFLCVWLLPFKSQNVLSLWANGI